jgi:rRNA biogenesis protein RRP5
LLEYKYGNAEKAKTIFETLIAEFPKKADIWNVYIDAEVKNSPKFPQELFEQLFTINWSSKTKKTFEEKYHTLR